jgi:transposase
VVHIAQSLEVSRRSLYNWLARYTQGSDPAAWQEQGGRGRPSVWSSELTALLAGSLVQPPEAWGYEAVEWTVPLVVAHLAAISGQRVSASSVRRQLRYLGYVWKRPRYVLQPEPAREKKTHHPPSARPAGAAQRRAL